MVARIKEPHLSKAPLPAALIKPAAVAVMLGCLGAALPWALPQIAQEDYRASTVINLKVEDAFSAQDWAEFEQHLHRQLTSESTLSGALTMAGPNLGALGLSGEPSLIALLGDLIGVTQSAPLDRDVELRAVLRERLLLSLAQEPSQTLTISLDAADANLAQQLVDYFSVAAQTEAEAYNRTAGDLELANAREALDKVEAQLTGFQMRHGDAGISQMLQLDQEFKSAKRAVDLLRKEQGEVMQALALAKSLKPAQALAEPLLAVIGFDALRDLQQSYSRAKANLAGLGADYGPKHPKVIAAQSNLDQISVGAAQALKQSREELERSDKAVKSELNAAEQKLAQLDERLGKLGNAPDELTSLEKRLDAARQHFLSLADIAQPGISRRQVRAEAVMAAATVSPLINYALMAIYSALSGLVFAAFGFWLMRQLSREQSREKKAQMPVQQTELEQRPVASRRNIEELKARLHAPLQEDPQLVDTAPVMPQVAKTVATLRQDNDTPFDQKVKDLLLRNAVKDPDATLQHLPQLVRAAALGELTLTESERRELNAIQQELGDLRVALDDRQSLKSKRSAVA